MAAALIEDAFAVVRLEAAEGLSGLSVRSSALAPA
jgi:hypothetical protein